MSMFKMEANTTGGGLQKKKVENGEIDEGEKRVVFELKEKIERNPLITEAQRRELDHQVFIFNHFAYNIPLPHYLLQFPSVMSEYGCRGSDCRTMFDSEPHRCRRTDGKKWRCSKDTVPNQKYCERHMHRGRNRSRKLVEAFQLSSLNLKTRPSNDNSHAKQVPKIESAVSNPNPLVIQHSHAFSYTPPRSFCVVNNLSSCNRTRNAISSDATLVTVVSASSILPPAVRPMVTTASILAPAPAVGPKVTTASILAPAVGPKVTTASILAPTVEPNVTTASILAPTVGPKVTTASILTPAVRPNVTTASILTPAVRPNVTTASILTPAVRPNVTTALILAPAAGPKVTIGDMASLTSDNRSRLNVCKEGFSPKSVLQVSGCNGSYLNYTNTIVEPEPGRCRRTDGKRWRCKSAVLPGQKYCATHMHRGAKRRRTNTESPPSTIATTTSISSDVTIARLPYAAAATDIQKVDCRIPNTQLSMSVPESAAPSLECKEKSGGGSSVTDASTSTTDIVDECSYLSF